MSDWVEKALDEVILKRNQGVNTTTEKVKYSEAGIKVIRANNISQGRIDYTDCVFVDDETYARIKEPCKPKKGDILYTNIGSQFGNAAKVEVDFEFTIAWNVLRIQPSDSVDSDFLVYLLNNPMNKKYIQSLNSSSTMPFVSGKDIGKTTFKFPEINEQQDIGLKLKSLDLKIELNRQTIQTLEHIAQAIFKSWFVDFEPTRAKVIAKQIAQARQDSERSAALNAALFADGRWSEAVAAAIAEGDPERAAMAAISGKSLEELDQLSPEQQTQLTTTTALFPDALVDSELGEIPEGWEVNALDEIAHYQNGLALQKFRPEDKNDFLPVLKIAQLKKGFADGEEKASPNIKPECIVDNGDVVFSWSGSLVVDVWCGGKAALNQHLFKVTSPDYPKWLYCYWTKHHLETFQQVAADKAVTMGHIKRSHLAEAKCIVPSCDLDQFSLMANFLEKQIEQRLESISLQEIRDSLLPKLLSGNLALDAPQSKIEEAMA